MVEHDHDPMPTAHLQRLNAAHGVETDAGCPSWWWACSAAAAMPSRALPPTGVVGFASGSAGAGRCHGDVLRESPRCATRMDQLTARAATPEVAEAMKREMAWYDAYLRSEAAWTGAPTPRPATRSRWPVQYRREGDGLHRQVRQRQPSPVCMAPGENLRQKGITRGLLYAATPASDFICGTLQLAAGMNLHVFTTGRGTPYGLAQCPVIKVATRTDLARRWHDIMDVNAGRVADGEVTIEELGWELFRLMLDVASGKKTWAEQWKFHNALALFNPAPVT